jgi:Holliday junction resolvase
MIPKFKAPVRETQHVQQPVVRYARSKGFDALKISGPGRRSYPDYMFLGDPGIIFFIEFKRPKKKPTEKQQKKIDRLLAMGFDVWWTDSADEGKKIIDLYL